VRKFINIVGLLGVACFALSVTLLASRLTPGVATGLAVAGGGLLAVYAAFNRRELAALARRRSARRGANAVLTTVLFATILVVVQAISVRNSHDLDLTRDARFTLATQTVDLLEALDTDVTVQVFFRRSSPALSRTEDLVGRYARYTNHLHYETIDPDEKPLVAQQLGVRGEKIVVTAGERSRMLDTVSEEALTNAILLVSLDRYKAIYFTSGHGERLLTTREGRGYTELGNKLQTQGYQVRELSLLGVERVPEDSEVLVIAGPKRRFLAGEIDVIRLYLRRGGSVMFLIDPRVELPELERLLGDYHVILDPATILDEIVVVDASERVFDVTVAKIRRYEPHAITRDFNFVTMFPTARPVRLDHDAMGPSTTGSYLAVTEMTAWGEIDIESLKAGSASRDGEDIAPPLPVAAVVTDRPAIASPQAPQPESRLIIIGDSDFVSNSYFGLMGNADFFLNCINFLAEDEDRISIRPRASQGDRFLITAAQGRFIFAASVIMLPLCVILIGTTVLVRKRRA